MLLENNNASISVNVTESKFRNRGTVYLWNTEYWALDSGIQLKETRITLMIAIRNPNSTNKESGIPKPESRAWNPETKTVMDYLARGEVEQAKLGGGVLQVQG